MPAQRLEAIADPSRHCTANVRMFDPQANCGLPSSSVGGFDHRPQSISNFAYRAAVPTDNGLAQRKRFDHRQAKALISGRVYPERGGFIKVPQQAIIDVTRWTTVCANASGWPRRCMASSVIKSERRTNTNLNWYIWGRGACSRVYSRHWHADCWSSRHARNGAVEAIRHSERARISCNADDPDELASLMRLLLDRQLRARLAANARHAICAHDIRTNYAAVECRLGKPARSLTRITDSPQRTDISYAPGHDRGDWSCRVRRGQGY
jgi:hypothetical protein